MAALKATLIGGVLRASLTETTTTPVASTSQWPGNSMSPSIMTVSDIIIWCWLDLMRTSRTRVFASVSITAKQPSQSQDGGCAQVPVRTRFHTDQLRNPAPITTTRPTV